MFSYLVLTSQDMSVPESAFVYCNALPTSHHTGVTAGISKGFVCWPAVYITNETHQTCFCYFSRKVQIMAPHDEEVSFLDRKFYFSKVCIIMSKSPGYLKNDCVRIVYAQAVSYPDYDML